MVPPPLLLNVAGFICPEDFNQFCHCCCNLHVAIISSSISSSLLLLLLLCCYYNISTVILVHSGTWIQQKLVSESWVLVSLFSHVLCPQEYTNIWKENSCHKWWIIKSAVNCRICWWKGNEQTKKEIANMRCAQPEPVHSIALAEWME
jgi:hypothetical protein